MRVAVPTAFGPDQALTFTRLLAMRPLHGLFRQPDPVVCDVVGPSDGPRWRLGMTDREAATLLPQVRTQLPGVQIDLIDDRGLPALDWAAELRLDHGERPLPTDMHEPEHAERQKNDRLPFMSIASTINTLGKGLLDGRGMAGKGGIANLARHWRTYAAPAKWAALEYRPSSIHYSLFKLAERLNLDVG